MRTAPRALFLLLALAACHRRRGGTTSRVSSLAASRLAPHAWGRAGDLQLRAAGATLTVAAGEDALGHRPLRGAVLDARNDDLDRADPLLWWRPLWVDALERSHVAVASEVTSTRCAGGAAGVRSVATVDGVRLDTQLCVAGARRFRATTEATGLPAGARLGDEVNPGSAATLAEGVGATWEGNVTTRFLALIEHDTALVFTTSETATARRALVHIATETFPAPVTWTQSGSRFVREVEVIHGDEVDALARVSRGRVSQVFDVVGATESRFEVFDARGAVRLRGALAQGRRRVALAEPFASSVIVYDRAGVAGPRLEVPRGDGRAAVTVRDGSHPSASVSLRFTDDGGRAMPVHVLFEALDGRGDATLERTGDLRGHASGRTLYLLDGRATVRLRPGRWRVVATRGTAWTLFTEALTTTENVTSTVEGSLRRVIAPSGWVSADLHLHATPSPDSKVTLEERVASLVCNGVDVAAATDHNRITDYRDAVRTQSLGDEITVLAGDEVTSAGVALWGHFNAFPLAVPDARTAPDDAVPWYFNRSPEEMFRRAREMGASVVMVNHPRMPPSIGYFDLTHFEAATGAAGRGFSEGFDTLEVFNGIWLETPEKVREGIVDLAGLARRGLRVTAVGNSDSHRLVHEEAGYPRTWVQVGEGPRETLSARVLSALHAGRTSVSAGPFVELTIDGQGSGSTVRPSPGLPMRVRAHVRVSAPAWVPVEHVELWVDDAVSARIPVTSPATDGVRYEGDHDLAITGDAMVLAWADASQPLPLVLPLEHAVPIGFSGPVWVDANGDGAVRLRPRASAPAPGSQR